MTMVSPLEKYLLRVKALIKKFKAPLLSGIISGFLAHMYTFTNKLLNADEVTALFAKGGTVTFGRWGLEIIDAIFPNFSMPWIYGVISIVLLSISVCIITSILGIKNKLVQVVLAAIFTTFRSVFTDFMFMFAASSYCLAVLLAVLSVYLTITGEIKKQTIGAILLALSLSIYQTYITLVASLYVILLIKNLIVDQNKFKDVLLSGIKYLGLIAVAVAIYYVVLLAFEATGKFDERSTYAYCDTPFIGRIKVAYTAFIGVFLKGYHNFICSKYSLVIHIIAILCAGYVFMKALMKVNGHLERLLTVVLLILLPLSINSIYLVSNVGVIHSMNQFGFVSLYIFIALLADTVELSNIKLNMLKKDALIICLALITVSNIYLANEGYLALDLNYKNTETFYTTLLANIYNNPDYTAETPVALVGEQKQLIHQFDEFDDVFEDLSDNSYSILNVYTRQDFIRYYLGSDIIFTSVLYTEEIENMDVYPNANSIKLVDGVLVVKLG